MALAAAKPDSLREQLRHHLDARHGVHSIATRPFSYMALAGWHQKDHDTGEADHHPADLF